MGSHSRDLKVMLSLVCLLNHEVIVVVWFHRMFSEEIFFDTTNMFFCSANQWTGFDMVGTLTVCLMN